MNRATSDRLFERALRYVAGGTSNLKVSTLPLYLAHAEGACLRDVDGNEYVDFANNWTTLVHGHGHSAIVDAATDAVRHGVCVSVLTEHEANLAELLCTRIESVERVKFANTGSAAVELALKCAWEWTGRRKIAKLEGSWHGCNDVATISAFVNPGNWGDELRPSPVKGTPNQPDFFSDNVVVLPSDVDAARELLLTAGSDLAAILVDLNPRSWGWTPLPDAYVQMLRETATRTGALLIVDEVVSFRLGTGGAQARYGLTPDLTVLGKLIGGGFPVGALGGRAELMDLFDAPPNQLCRVPIFGTFTANPITMAAGVASVRTLGADEIAQLNQRGDALRGRLDEAFGRAGIAGSCSGVGSLFVVHVGDDRRKHDYRSCMPLRGPDFAARAWLHDQLVERGFVFNDKFSGCLSTAMTPAHLDALVEAFEDTLKRLPPPLRSPRH